MLLVYVACLFVWSMLWLGISPEIDLKADPSLPSIEEEPATDGEIMERGVLHSSFWE